MTGRDAACAGCGNDLAGDNLCMVSACQWEGTEGREATPGCYVDGKHDNEPGDTCANCGEPKFVGQEVASRLCAGCRVPMPNEWVADRCASCQAGRQTTRSRTEWAVLGTLRGHLYDYRQKGSKPDDPGWHVCSCGWEGYWCDYQPHVAEKIMEALDA